MNIQFSIAIFFLEKILFSDQRCLRYAVGGKCREVGIESDTQVIVKAIGSGLFQECFPGYVGKDCSHTCRYPNYGAGCQEVCQCDQRVCQPIKGCTQSADCPPGYFGYNCVDECRYPNYGVNCQYYCNCGVQLCSKTTGCEITRGENKQTMPSYLFNTAESRQPPYVDVEEILTHKSSLITTKSEYFSSSAPALFNASNTVDQGTFSFHTNKQTQKSTYMIPVSTDYVPSVFSNLNNPFTLSLITGGLFLFSVICVAVYKLKSRLTLTPNRDVERQSRGIHHQSSKRMLKLSENDEVSSCHLSNAIMINNGIYETIDQRSDNLDGNFTTETENLTTNNQQSTAILPKPEELDAGNNCPDGYLMPGTINRSEKTTNRDTCDDKYLTIV